MTRIKQKYFFLMYFHSRFPVAIKCAINLGPEKTNLFLDEAKTMLEIGSYHDFIVNLQGIIYNTNDDDEQAPEVRVVYEIFFMDDKKCLESKYLVSGYISVLFFKKGCTSIGVLFKRRLEIIPDPKPERIRTFSS